MDKKTEGPKTENIVYAEELSSTFNIPYEGENAIIKGVSDATNPQENFLIFIKDVKYLPVIGSAYERSSDKSGNKNNAENDSENIFFLPANLKAKVNEYLERQGIEKGVEKRGKKGNDKDAGKLVFFYSQNFTTDFIRLLDHFDPYKKYRKIPASILNEDHKKKHPSISPDLFSGPFVSVGDGLEVGENSSFLGNNFIGHAVKIGSNVTLHPGVVLGDGTVIGDNTIIHPGTVIGGEGFGYEASSESSSTSLIKVPQIGRVEIGNNVEIGSNVSIDRATITATKIGNNVKIDNLVQIAHNVNVGDNSIIVSQTGIAGSSKIGRGVILAGQVGVSDHVEIGEGAVLGPQCGVMANSKVPAGSKLLGSPSTDLREFLRMNLFLKKLYQEKTKSKN